MKPCSIFPGAIFPATFCVSALIVPAVAHVDTGQDARAAQDAAANDTAANEAVRAGVEAWSRGDYWAAVEHWRAPAIAGNADAQFNLGQAYKLGRGVSTDLVQAEEWFRRAAIQGHAQGEDNYGLILFQNGRRQEALPWLERSANRGEPRAQYVLGTMYFNGDVVQRDWVRAYALTVRSSQSGLTQANQGLAQMDQYISLADRQAGLTLARQMEERASRPPLIGEFSGPIVSADTRPSTTPTPIGAPPPMRPAPRPIQAVEPEPGPLAPPERGQVQPMPTLPPAQAPAQSPQQPTPRPAATPQPTPRPTPRPAAPAPRDGGWRIQLGAFGQPGNARNQWATVSRLPAMRGHQPYYVRAGALTRLLVGPYANRADANAGCSAVRAAGHACIVVAP